MKFLYFLLALGLGFLLIRYEKWIMDNTGMRFDFAERFFGPGGTHTALKLLGLVVIAYSFYYMFGQ